MTTFKNNPDEMQRLDWSILQNGWISLYLKNEILEKDLEWFKTENYSIVDFECKTWTNENEMHNQFKKRLCFPEYYGENINALNDCLSDIEIVNAGQIIVFRHLDSIDIKLAHILLDVFADNARKHMLFGERLLILSQVDNPNFRIEPVGATPIIWNRQEWLNSKRR